MSEKLLSEQIENIRAYPQDIETRATISDQQLKWWQKMAERLEAENYRLRKEQLKLIANIEGNCRPRHMVKRWILDIKERARIRRG